MKELFYTTIGGAIILFLFFSFINIIGKTMKSGARSDSSQTSDILKKQSDKTQDLHDDQKILMEERKRQLQQQQRDLKDRMRDINRH